jgi:hypothetical protein
LFAGYQERYQSRHGFLRPILPEVVHTFFDCGDGKHEYLLAVCVVNRYSNEVRGQRDQHAAEEAAAAGQVARTHQASVRRSPGPPGDCLSAVLDPSTPLHLPFEQSKRSFKPVPSDWCPSSPDK